MQAVTANLGKVPDVDVRAIATYVASFVGPRNPADRQRQTDAALGFAKQRAVNVGDVARTTTGVASADDRSAGGVLFAGACASCHRSGGGLPASRPIALALSSPVNASEPTNLLRIIADGIHPAPGAPGPVMKGLNSAL